MFIRAVDEGLERMLRAQLPLPADAGDISFATPNAAWSAQLTRPTVNLFLYEIAPSSRPMQAAIRKTDANGQGQRRPPLPMVELNYLVSVYATTSLDEHQLLGSLVNRLAGAPVLPEEYLTNPPSSAVRLGFGDDEHSRPREVWLIVGSPARASFTLTATVAADSFDWIDEAAAVTSVQGLTRSNPTAAQP